MGMEIYSIIGYASAAFLFVLGLVQIITKKIVGCTANSVKNADIEKKKKFAVVSGLIYVISAIVIFLYYLFANLFFAQIESLKTVNYLCYTASAFVILGLIKLAENKILK